MQINQHDTSHQQRQNKKQTIISIDGEKAFEKLQHTFIIKTLTKVGIEETHLNIMKAIYGKPIANYHTQQSKTENISSKSRTKTRIPTLTIYIQHRIGSPNHSNQTRKRNKSHPN